ncbi:MAG: hypothetical protein QF473_25475 [Planctomycetota bacterium]|nr:hypothetical protein [Planctomycetota bacterium]
MNGLEWSRGTYDRSVSSECWWFTPFDRDDPTYWDAVSKDEEMREILAMEQSLAEVPDWARSVGIGYLPPCGHWKFPGPLLQILTLIGSANPVTIGESFKLQCYTVDRERKRAAQDYCLCLDAWLAGTGPEVPAFELNALASRKIDWTAVCSDLWNVLGERSEKKELIVERVLIAVRHAVKASRWDDERGTEFGRDQYLGDFSLTPDGEPACDALSSPRVQRIETKLAASHPGWRSLIKVDLGFWWLCAPKAFRFLERDLWAIGKDRSPEKGEEVPGFLRCEDLYPNQDEAAEWYEEFCAALDAWWQGNRPTGPAGELVCQRLGDSSPVKQWLVRLFRKKLRMYETTGGSIANLVNPKPRQKRGTKFIEIG